MPIFGKAGLTTIEITMNTEGAEGIVKYGIGNLAISLNIGAGAVCTKKIYKAIEAGVQFIVTQIVGKKIIRECVKKQIPIFQGAFTASELMVTESIGIR